MDDALSRTGPLAMEKSGDFPTARPFAHKLHRALFGSDKITESQNQPHHRSTDRNRQGSTYQSRFSVQTNGATSVIAMRWRQMGFNVICNRHFLQRVPTMPLLSATWALSSLAQRLGLGLGKPIRGRWLA